MLTYNEVPAGIMELLEKMDWLENAIKQLLKSHSQPPVDEYLTRKEAAAILHISLPTLLDWTLEGKFSGYRIGKRVLYKRNEINAAVKPMKISK